MSKLKYALFTGCTAKQSTPEQYKSTMAIANKLDIEFVATPPRKTQWRTAAVVHHDDFKIGNREVHGGNGCNAFHEFPLPIVRGNDDGKQGADGSQCLPPWNRMNDVGIRLRLCPCGRPGFRR